MKKACAQCSAPFEVTEDDLKFYGKVSPVIGKKRFDIPAPMMCPDCRAQNRFAFRNERALYHRKCDKTGKQIISVYSSDKPYIVYEPATWWTDAYDPLAYGRDFDFSRPFFDQFNELNLAVPKSAIQNAKSENCDYTNYSAENKNCYLVVGGLGAEDCMYCYRVFYSSDVVDSYDVIKCERCYECSESAGLYDCRSCHACHDCSDCELCDNCTGCRNCFGCANLRNKEFHIYNRPFSEVEYKEKMAQIRAQSNPQIEKDVRKLHLSVPHRAVLQLNCEECRGDQLIQCRNCIHCYTLKHSQDCHYCAVGENNRDCSDCNFFDNCELQWSSSNNEKNYHIVCSMLIWYCKEVFYSMNSFNSNHLFGCSGMKKNEYCILNKQYTKEEYEELVPKIIDHMKKTPLRSSGATEGQAGEWGHFFPASISPFGYNETVAHEEYPLTRQEVTAYGWKWKDEEEEKEKYLGPPVELPPTIEEVDDSICQKILTCGVTGKPYKIIPQELKFYREMLIPIPRKCPDQRHKERMAMRNPRRLWKRECAKCEKEIETTYAPERPEIIYCEQCYLSTVY